MSAEPARPVPGTAGDVDAVAQRYATIIVVGGGCYGSYYVRQLRRGAMARAIQFERLVVVDRDRTCAVAVREDAHDAEARSASDLGVPAPELAVAEWSEFFAAYLRDAASTPTKHDADAIVPSPLMPHLMYEWLLQRARERWPTRVVETRPLDGSPAVPWQRANERGTHYVSFAEWMCPVNCIEPAKCPVTRGPRSWTMPAAVREYAESERARGRPIAGPAIFHCSHRAYGVGMLDTRDVVAADSLVSRSGATGEARVLVGTVSHCHGALSLLHIGE